MSHRIYATRARNGRPGTLVMHADASSSSANIERFAELELNCTAPAGLRQRVEPGSAPVSPIQSGWGQGRETFRTSCGCCPWIFTTPPTCWKAPEAAPCLQRLPMCAVSSFGAGRMDWRPPLASGMPRIGGCGLMRQSSGPGGSIHSTSNLRNPPIFCRLSMRPWRACPIMPTNFQDAFNPSLNLILQVWPANHRLSQMADEAMEADRDLAEHLALKQDQEMLDLLDTLKPIARGAQQTQAALWAKRGAKALPPGAQELLMMPFWEALKEVWEQEFPDPPEPYDPERRPDVGGVDGAGGPAGNLPHVPGGRGEESDRIVEGGQGDRRGNRICGKRKCTRNRN